MRTSIKKQFEEINFIPVFEIEVTDKRTQETEYIVFDIKAYKKYFKATHESLTYKQKDSNKIAFVSVEIDNDSSLDKNLNELYSECCDAIICSDFYELND